MKNRKVAHLPCMKPHYNEARLQYAKERVSVGDKRPNVTFGNENKMKFRQA